MNQKSAKRKQKISCGALTYKFGDNWDDTQILLVKQFNNREGWGIPKGHLNKKETYVDCAIRETKEETGIDVSLGERLPDVTISYRNSDKLVISYLAIQTCNNHPFSQGLESEVADARWFKISNMPKIYDYQSKLIDAGLNKMREFFNERNK